MGEWAIMLHLIDSWVLRVFFWLLNDLFNNAKFNACLSAGEAAQNIEQLKLDSSQRVQTSTIGLMFRSDKLMPIHDNRVILESSTRPSSLTSTQVLVNTGTS